MSLFGVTSVRASGSRVDMEDWTEANRAAAAREGWCITEVGMKDTPSYLVIRNVADSGEPSLLLVKEASLLASDDEAVASFRRSWLEGRDHALLAYALIRFNSPAEFHFWSMADWSREELG